MDHSQHLFHYTGAGAILSIVTRRQLWATNSESMNDRFEGALPSKALLDICRNPRVYLPNLPNVSPRHLEVLRESLSMGAKLSLTSLSRHWRSLPMYRMYAPAAGGFVIGFPRDYLSAQFQLSDVSYENAELWAWARSYAEDFLDRTASLDDGLLEVRDLRNLVMRSRDYLQQRALAGMKFKSDEFINEAEVRIVSFGGATHCRESRDGNYVIPYQVHDLPNEPIEVLLSHGPNKDEALARDSYVHLIQAAQRAGTKWEFSHLSSGEYGFRA